MKIKFRDGSIKDFETLYNANLYNANLSYANLSYANLVNANLVNANLRYANLVNANLSYANLYNADLRYANLVNANLSYANLYNADLRYAKGILSFIGEKDLLVYFKYNNIYYFKIGCITRTLDYWKENFKEIGIKQNYDSETIKLYGDVIELFSKYDLDHGKK